MGQPECEEGSRLRRMAIHLLVSTIALPRSGGRAVVIAVHPEHLTQGKQRADVFVAVHARLRTIVIDGALEPQYRLVQAVAAKQNVSETQLGVDVSVAGAP